MMLSVTRFNVCGERMGKSEKEEENAQRGRLCSIVVSLYIVRI